MASISTTRPRLLFRATATADGRPQRTWRPELKTILGSVGKRDQVSLYDVIADDGAPIARLSADDACLGGGPRIWCPCIRPGMPIEEYIQQPIMMYLPGFEGSGMAASRQFLRLMEAFELVCLTIPIDDGHSFSEVVDMLVADLREYLGKNENGRPVYLLGESLGGLMAIAVAHRCPECIDRLVLVNPATSYNQSIWPIIGPLLSMIPNGLYGGVAFAMAPLLGNPLSLLAHHIDTNRPLPNQMEGLLEGISELFGSLLFMGDIFTPERVAVKLRLVQQGMVYTDPLIQQRTLLLVGDGDWMLPSGNEKGRLPPRMPRCYVRSMGPRSHALLQEGGIDLVQILKEEGFYVTQRRFTSQNGTEPVINQFGTASPIELPTDIEFKKSASVITSSNIFTSPVFYSTDQDARIIEGLDALPDGAPLLIVGNHQLLGQDSSTIVAHVFKEKGILIRALAHPFVAQDRLADREREENEAEMPEWIRRGGNFISTFGVVRVRSQNLHTLLSNGERILLYPGGARESFHLKNEGYQLFWPERAEFVRMASKFGATVVTLAAVGLEESMEILMDRKEILNTPILKEWTQNYIKNIPKARSGQGDRSKEDIFLPPIIRPKVPHRQYFLFGKPFVMTPDYYEDKQKADTVYQQIKQQLEENIVYLQRKAKEDPYGDFLKRVVYENGDGRGRAPSFIP